LERFKNSKSKK
jgi:hypothetical protein